MVMFSVFCTLRPLKLNSTNVTVLKLNFWRIYENGIDDWTYATRRLRRLRVQGHKPRLRGRSPASGPGPPSPRTGAASRPTSTLVERYDAVKFGIFQRNLSNFRGLVLFCTSYGARPQARAVNLSLKSKSWKFPLWIALLQKRSGRSDRFGR